MRLGDTVDSDTNIMRKPVTNFVLDIAVSGLGLSLKLAANARARNYNRENALVVQGLVRIKARENLLY
jgi:hypothetical protein